MGVTSGVGGGVVAGVAVGDRVGLGGGVIDGAALIVGAGLGDGEVGEGVDSGPPQANTRIATNATAILRICQPPHMHYQRFGDRYQLRIASGEKLLENLLRFLAAQRIGYATMTGLGAVRHATVSYWNSTTQQYEAHEIDEQVELVSLVGNVTIKDGAPFVHAHVTLGRSDLSILGGHFNEAVVHPNVELWIRPESEAVERTLDESCGLYLMALPERL